MDRGGYSKPYGALEELGMAELEHNAHNNRMRAI
jgi:hypothetical protein